MKTGAVIAAAGMSTRMGQFKQLMKIGGLTIVERVVMNFQQAEIEEVAVVTGFCAEQVEKVLCHRKVTCIRNEDYETTQMFESVKIGLEYMKERCDQVFFCPADVPVFTEETLRNLTEQKGSIVMPIYKRKHGHPVRIHSSLIPSILKYQGEGGLRGALNSLGIEMISVQVRDEGTIIDADIPPDYQHLIEIYNTRLMQMQAKMCMTNYKTFLAQKQ